MSRRWGLGELVVMADAKRREQWDHTAELLALIANTNRDPNKRSEPFVPADFHRYRLRNLPTLDNLPREG